MEIIVKQEKLELVKLPHVASHLKSMGENLTSAQIFLILRENYGVQQERIQKHTTTLMDKDFGDIVMTDIVQNLWVRYFTLLFRKLEAYSVLQYMYLWMHVAWNT